MFLLAGLNVVLSVVVIILLVRKDSEIRKVARRVDLKSLQLKEQAIEMQMKNVGGLLQQVSNQQNDQNSSDDAEPARTPVGYARR